MSCVHSCNKLNYLQNWACSIMTCHVFTSVNNAVRFVFLVAVKLSGTEIFYYIILLKF